MEPKQTILSNGLTILVEEVPTASSAAVSIIIPSGAVYEEEKYLGVSSLLSDILQKGAGEYDSRGLSEAFEDRGIQRSLSAGVTSLSGSLRCLPEEVPEALRLLSLIILQPRIPEEEIEPTRLLLLQELESLNDQPSSLAMVELSKLFYGNAHGRSTFGSKEGLLAIDQGTLRNFAAETIRPEGAIISVAGKVNAQQVTDQICSLFNDWAGERAEAPEVVRLNERRYKHVLKESAQLQLALAFPSLEFSTLIITLLGLLLEFYLVVCLDGFL